MAEKFRVLVAPLDWGLGHASRCVPIIRELLNQGFEPILGGTKESLYLLGQDFPELKQVKLPAYKIGYTEGEKLLIGLIIQAPRVLGVRYFEKWVLFQLQKKWKFDAIISDNRYGVFLSKVPSFFVCHQLTLRSEETPTWLLKAANRKNRKMIQKFDECWVPDYEGDNNLAGDLSKGNLNIPIRYLGALSRFQPLKPCENQTKEKIDILIVLSGPEPQRSILEASLIEQIPNIDRHFTLIQGKPGEVEEHSEANYRIVPFMNSRELQHAFQEASCVISRSGYSSLMDYEALGISRLILLPTPGQPEQEYLGEIWKEKQKAIVQPQKELDLKQALEAVEDLKKTSATFISGEGLSKGVAALKKRLHSLKK